MLTAIVWFFDAAIIAAYFVATRNPKQMWWFHFANAVGGVPLLISEVVVHAWGVLPVTLFFTAIGWYGLAKDWMMKPMWTNPGEKPAPVVYEYVCTRADLAGLPNRSKNKVR